MIYFNICLPALKNLDEWTIKCFHKHPLLFESHKLRLINLHSEDTWLPKLRFLPVDIPSNFCLALSQIFSSSKHFHTYFPRLRDNICLYWVSSYWFQTIQLLKKSHAPISRSNWSYHCRKHGASCYLQNYKLSESRQSKINHFKYMVNKSSPKTDPWGTPLINSFHELRGVLTKRFSFKVSKAFKSSINIVPPCCLDFFSNFTKC